MEAEEGEEEMPYNLIEKLQEEGFGRERGRVRKSDFFFGGVGGRFWSGGRTD